MHQEINQKTVLGWMIGIAAAVIGFMAYNHWYHQQREDADTANVAALVKHQIATLWHPDSAMKFAQIQSLTLKPTQPGEYHGELVYTFGEYEKKMPVSAMRKPDGSFDLSLDAPNNMPMRVETIVTSQMFFEWPVTEDEAVPLACWLALRGLIGDEPGTSFLRKEGAKFVYHIAVEDRLWPNPELEKIATDIAMRLPVEVFADGPVEVHICDQKLRT